MAGRGRGRWWAWAGAVALAVLGARARAEAQPTQAEPQVPAAWVGTPGKASGLLDVRGFYHYASGGRDAWSGTELLSYFDLTDGFSGAFVLRQEARDEVARYGTMMLIPQLSDKRYLVLATGVGNGANFQPVTRLDVQLRGFFDGWRGVMYDVGGYATWWTSERRQAAQSAALIFWRLPYIVELRELVTYTDPGLDPGRFHGKLSAVVLWGADNHHWLLARAAVGTEPANEPGMSFALTEDRPVANLAVGYRRWLTADYGVSAEVEVFGQANTWWRAGVLTSVFADFH
ncbi:MAG: hypothetical protein R2939_17890 [Kofleriaceae bacterium]